MWRRLMRRTFAPRRPLLYLEQWPLALVTVILLAVGVAFALAVIK